MRVAVVLACLSVVACSRAHIGAPGASPPVDTAASERVVPGMVTGYVLDGSGRAVDQAILLLDSRTTGRADATGRFHFDAVARGTHTIEARSFGYVRATQTFSLDQDAGATFVFRLNPSHEREVVIEAGCFPPARPSVIVRAPAVAHATVAVAHGDSLQRFAFDSLDDVPDASGMRVVSAFGDMAGRFDVAVSAPGYRVWRASVTVTRGRCHVNSQTVTAVLVREH